MDREQRDKKRKQALEIIAETAECLLEKADAFAATGNQYLAEDLAFFANKLAKSVRVLEEVDRDRVYSEFKQAQESSSNMLRAVLAVSQMRAEKEEN